MVIDVVSLHAREPEEVDLSADSVKLAGRPAERQASLLGIITAGIALFATIQFALFGYFVIRTVIASPISDSFAYIEDYLQFRAGEVTLLDYLWQAHGEHHLVWIRFLTWVDVAFFHTRAISSTIAATGAIAATAVLIWNQLRRAEPRLGVATCLGLLVPMVVLNAANATDCSLPINTTYTFTVFFAVLTLVLFTHPEDSNVKPSYWRVAGLLTAFGASFGTAAGLLLWPILLWLAWRECIAWRWQVMLAGLGIGYCLFYLRGLRFLGLDFARNGTLMTFLSAPHLYKLADYFFAFLGLPFTREPAFGAVGRVIGVALFLAAASTIVVATFSNRLNRRIDRIAVGMILLALGSAALATVGRGDMIAEVKVPVRYTIFATTLQAGLLCIILPAIERSATARVERLLGAMGMSLAIVLLILQVFIGRAAVNIADAISRDAVCFAEGAQNGPISQAVTRWPADASRVLAALRRQGLWAPRPADCLTRSAS